MLGDKGEMGKRLLPTGKCWCGCGADVPIGSFFCSGHDRRAESNVIAIEYGGVVGFLAQHGYGPDGKNPTEEFTKYLKGKGIKN